MKNIPPQQWSDLGWRDKLRLRIPDLMMVGCILILVMAYFVARWWS